MKNIFPPKRFVIACNQKLIWDWNALIQECLFYSSVHDMLYAIFYQSYLEGWNKFKRNVVYLNSEIGSVKWYSGQSEERIKDNLKNKEKLQDIFLRPYHKQTQPKYDFIALVKNHQNEMGILYIGDKFLIPEVHFKVSSKFFAIAHLFAENYELETMPSPYISGKMLYKNFNLPKAFHEYHKKIHDTISRYFSLGIDYKNRVLDYEKNQSMFLYHWASNQVFIERKSHRIEHF